MAVTEAQFARLEAKLDAVLKQEGSNAKTLEQIQEWQIAHDLAHARGENGGGGRLVPILLDVVKMLVVAILTLLGYTKLQHPI